VRSPSCQYEPSHSDVEQGSSRSGRLPRHGKGSWPCSSGSTCHGGNRPAGCTADIWRGMTSNKGSSMSHRRCHKSLAPSASSAPESSRLSSHRLATRPSGRFRRGCGRNPAVGQRHGGHSEAGCGRCRSRHRVESKPNLGQSNHHHYWSVIKYIREKRTLMAACRERAMSLSCSNLGLLPNISGSQNCPTAPFMWPIFP
jgi:hypothetical protein